MEGRFVRSLDKDWDVVVDPLVLMHTRQCGMSGETHRILLDERYWLDHLRGRRYVDWCRIDVDDPASNQHDSTLQTLHHYEPSTT
jgi:hypothetical protein